MNKSNSSYSQLLKATSILGSSQIVNIGLRLIRTKAIALLLGPAGIGLIGIFQSVVDMISSFCGLGLVPGAVKEVSRYNEGQEKQKLEKTIFIFRRWFALTACFGAVVCAISSYSISHYLFKDGSYTIPIVLLSVCVFFTIIASGRMAILQGMRKIPYMAKSTVLESSIGLFVIVAIYYYFGVEGIVPAFILNSVIIYACVNYYYRKVAVKKEVASMQETIDTGVKALRLGLFVTIGACISTASMFAARFIVVYYSGYTEAVGLYQSVWTITNVFTGFIIGAAGTDYFARLCSVSDDGVKTRTLMNEQSYIILALSTPVVVGIILFSGYILNIFYSSEFGDGQGMLQWQMVGVFLKIAATPIASILLAKQKGWLYLLSEFVFFASYLALSYFLVPLFDIAGAGMAYLLAYVLYLLIVFVSSYWLTKYTWGRRVLIMLIVSAVFVVSAFYIAYNVSSYLLVFASALLIISIVYSTYQLSRVFSFDQLESWFRKK